MVYSNMYSKYCPIQVTYECDYFELIVKKSGDTGLYTSMREKRRYPSFDRLAYNDIVDVHVNGINISVPYLEGLCDEANEWQKTWLEKDGSLHIISQKKMLKRGKKTKYEDNQCNWLQG